MVDKEWSQVLDLATPKTLTLMLALDIALAMALMPAQAVVVQARLCRKRLRVAGTTADAGADAVVYDGADARADACTDAGTSTDASAGNGADARAGADTSADADAGASADGDANVDALTLVIVASASKCSDERFFLYFQNTMQAGQTKMLQWILIPTEKKFHIVAPFLCSSTYFVQTSYFLCSI